MPRRGFTIFLIFAIIFAGAVLAYYFLTSHTHLGLLKEAGAAPPKTPMTKNLEGKKIAVIIAAKDFRDEEYFVPKNIFENYGVQVITASNIKGAIVGADGGEAEAEMLIEEVKPAEFDAVVFVGGPGALKYLDNVDSYRLVKETVKENRVLAAICVSPVILAKAGVLAEKKATVWSSPLDRGPVNILKNYQADYRNEPVVVDGKIITADGPAAADDFGQKISETLNR